MRRILISLFSAGMAFILLSQAGFAQKDRVILREISRESISPQKSELGTVRNKVTFGIFNGSTEPFWVHGQKTGDNFVPLFYVLTFSESQGKWRFPTMNGLPIPWEDESALYKDYYEVPPSDTFTFTILVTDRVHRMKFGTAVYFSRRLGSPPTLLFSEGIRFAQKK